MRHRARNRTTGEQVMLINIAIVIGMNRLAAKYNV
jgi:hypothetical protein